MTLTAERPPLLETDPVRTGAEIHLGQLSLQHEAARQQGIVRGDRLGEEDQNRGFRIEHLEGERSHEPVPVGAVLPDMAKRFAQEYVDGKLQIEEVKDAWTGMNRGLPGFITFFPVDASKYKAAVAEGKVPADLFGKDGKVSHLEPGADALEDLVDHDKKRDTVEAYYNQRQASSIRTHSKSLKTFSAITQQTLAPPAASWW
jgi:hypothetical protein